MPIATPVSDNLTASTRPRATWVLVQTEPSFAVLATADNAARLNREAAVLVQMNDERRGSYPLELEVRRTDHLVG